MNSQYYLEEKGTVRTINNNHSSVAKFIKPCTKIISHIPQFGDAAPPAGDVSVRDAHL